VLDGIVPLIEEELVQRQDHSPAFADSYWVIRDLQRGIEVNVECIGAEGYEFLSVLFNEPLGGTFEYDVDDSSIREFLRSLLIQEEVYRLSTFFGKVIVWSPTGFAFEGFGLLHPLSKALGVKESLLSITELCSRVEE